MCEFCGFAGVCIMCGHDHGREYRIICTHARKAGAIGVFGPVDVRIQASSANAAREVFAEQFERARPLMVFRQ